MARIIIILLLLSVNSYAINTNNISGNGPMGFIENKGQVTDQQYRSRTDIDLQLRAGNGLSIYIGKGALHYQFYSAETTNPVPGIFHHENIEESRYKMHRVDVELIGANQDAEIILESKQPYSEHYYTVGTGIKGQQVSSYNKVTYRNIYPDIDWVLYIANGQLKQEFVVREGGYVSDIQLRYTGQNMLQLQDDGSLKASTTLGTIHEAPPVSFLENGEAIDSRYKIKDNILSYVADSYNGTLTIDPAISWATYYGAASSFIDIATDSTGRYIYMSGNTTSTQNIATTGAHQTTIGGSVDALLTKFSKSGYPVWGTYFGGTKLDYGDDIEVSHYNSGVNGNHFIYLAGYTQSGNNIATPGAHDTVQDGSGDGYLAKFNDSGTLIWSTYFGGSHDDRIYCVFADNSGHVFIGGQSYSQTGVATIGAHQVVPNLDSNNSDGVVAQFNDSGILNWATYYGGQQHDWVWGVTSSGNDVYISGVTASTDSICTPGAHQTSLHTLRDGFMSKFTMSGTRQWGTYFGGEGMDDMYKPALDSKGNIYFCGTTYSKQNIATPGAHKALLTDNYGDGFLTKMNANGILQWSTYVGASDSDILKDIVIDEFDNIYVSGGTSSEANLVSPNAIQAQFGGGHYDGLFVKFDTTGNELWSTYYGGNNLEYFYGLAMNKQDIYLCGNTRSSNGIATPGAYKTTLAGFSDGFVARLCDTTPRHNAVYGVHDICFPGTDTLKSYYNDGTWLSLHGHVAVSTAGIVTSISAGVDTVLRMVSNACGTDTVRHALTVYPSPITVQPVTIAQSAGNNVQFSVVATGSSTSFQWQSDIGAGFQDIANGGQYSGATTAVLTVANIGTQNNNEKFRCVVKDNCEAISDIAGLYVWPLSVKDVTVGQVRYLPNPANDMITIDAAYTISNISITNMLGQQVHTETTNGKTIQLDIKKLVPGIYLLKVNNAYVGRLIKH